MRANHLTFFAIACIHEGNENESDLILFHTQADFFFYPLQTAMQKKIKRGKENVHDARRFVGHEKSLLNHKARTHGFDIKTPTMHRHKMKDTIPAHPNTHQLSPTQQHSLIGVFFCSRCGDLILPARFYEVFRCDAADLRRAGAQYGQLGLCAASPPELDAADAADADAALQVMQHPHRIEPHI